MYILYNFRTTVALVVALWSVSIESQTPAPQPSYTYADLADVATEAPIAAHVRVADSVRLKPEESPGLRPGRTRFYVRADLVSLILGTAGLPGRVSYLVDLSNDAAGKPPRLRNKSEFILLAAPVPGRPAELRLTGPDAQLPYSAADAARLRAILREASRGDAPPRIVGIGKAFHVPGSLPGESETQIFLLAADQRPVSLTVLRRPGESPVWAVSLSEIVDNAAAPPAPDTLLWYRLACGLPRSLPAASLSEAQTAEAEAIRADYGFVLERLGPCARNRRRA